MKHAHRGTRNMQQEKSKARRKLLKSIAAGSGAVVAGKSLPESWTRPVVDGVMLPAHAQTSMLNSSGPATPVGITMHEAESDSLLAQVSDTLLPEAHAGGGIFKPALVCVEHVQDWRGGSRRNHYGRELLSQLGLVERRFFHQPETSQSLEQNGRILAETHCEIAHEWIILRQTRTDNRYGQG